MLDESLLAAISLGIFRGAGVSPRQNSSIVRMNFPFIARILLRGGSLLGASEPALRHSPGAALVALGLPERGPACSSFAW